MKQLLILTLIIILSCSKTDDSNHVKCNCGIVTSKDQSNYSIVIKNNCTEKEKSFIINPNEWFNVHSGYDYCIDNVNDW